MTVSKYLADPRRYGTKRRWTRVISSAFNSHNTKRKVLEHKGTPFVLAVFAPGGEQGRFNALFETVGAVAKSITERSQMRMRRFTIATRHPLARHDSSNSISK